MKLFQLIKQAFSKSPGNDDTAYPVGLSSFNKRDASFIRFLPYGLSSLEPTGAFVLLLEGQGQESVRFGIPSAMRDRLKNLKAGEVALFNSETQTYIIFKQDGTFEINCDGQITGNLTIGGNLSVDGNISVGGTLDVTGAATLAAVSCTSISINGLSFSSHVHGGVDTGTGTSGGPQ